MLDAGCHLMTPTRQILGLRFFNGDVEEAVAFMDRHGGYLVAPSGTCFARLRKDEPYRRAMSLSRPRNRRQRFDGSHVAIVTTQKIQRISVIKYLKQLLVKLNREENARLFWILPNKPARQKLLDCFHRELFSVKSDDCYVAPRYGLEVEDRHLLRLIKKRQPAHIVIAIGSGPQEKLGHYLCENLSYRPAIHCTGAALGFITGDQITIPDWADRFFLGWFFRLIAQPQIFIPRLTRGLALPWLIWKYGQKMPVNKGSGSPRRIRPLADQ